MGGHSMWGTLSSAFPRNPVLGSRGDWPQPIYQMDLGQHREHGWPVQSHRASVSLTLTTAELNQMGPGMHTHACMCTYARTICSPDSP